MGGRRGVGDGADRGSGRGAEEPLRVAVPRLGAQPGAFGRRLVVRVQPLVRDPHGADARCRAAPLQVHPDGPIHHDGTRRERERQVQQASSDGLHQTAHGALHAAPCESSDSNQSSA